MGDLQRRLPPDRQDVNIAAAPLPSATAAAPISTMVSRPATPVAAATAATFTPLKAS